MGMTETLIALLAATLGVVLTLLVVGWFKRLGRTAETKTLSYTIAERVRSVGKLVGLEVMSKEIVTQTKGMGWLPPLLLSQARLAMIFCFNKQYYVDLSRVTPDQVKPTGLNTYEVVLPPIEGSLSLLEITPYDIQSGKLLGLLDVFRMDATTQKTLMQRAQVEAEGLYEQHAARYEAEARRVIVRQLRGLLDLFEVEATIRFQNQEVVHGPKDEEETVSAPVAV